MNIADVLRRRAPGSPAVIEDGAAIPGAALDAAVDRACHALAARGIGPGVAVALMPGPDSAPELVAMLALARLGAAQLLLSSGLPPLQIEAEARRHGAVAVIGARTVAGLPLIQPDRAWLQGPRPTAFDGHPGGVAPWIILFSSGTTGRPKAMAVTHAMTLPRLEADAALMRRAPDERCMSLVGLGFWTGRFRALGALHDGATVVFDSRLAGDPCGRITALGVTSLTGTPSHMDALLRSPGAAPRLPGLRMLRSASAALPEPVRQAVRRDLSPHLMVSYGSNEIGPICGALPEDVDLSPGSVGRPLPGVELEIIDAEGRPADQGEVRLRGAGMIAGYVGDPAATAEAFRDGWFHPGDLARRDARGCIQLLGRANEVMNFDGTLVSPQEIETVLLDHPGVAEAAVFALPSARFGQVPVAAIVPRGAMDAAALLAWCRQRLGSRAPASCMRVDALPRNAMGKVLRRELLARYRAALARGAHS